ncbi:MAG: DUF4070 domain-containing protein [Pyrinomonadaceae bacterium]
MRLATFHIPTPYPGTALYDRMQRAGRILHTEWDLYDTRHTVFRPARMTPHALEEGYWQAYKQFYRWHYFSRGSDKTGFDRRGTPRRLCWRLEKVRASLGHGDSSLIHLNLI